MPVIALTTLLLVPITTVRELTVRRRTMGLDHHAAAGPER
jgi:hypothetical protein